MVMVDQPPPNFFAPPSSPLPPPPVPVVREKARETKATFRQCIPFRVVDFGPLREKKGPPNPRRESGVHPELTEAGQSSSVSAFTSRPRPNSGSCTPTQPDATPHTLHHVILTTESTFPILFFFGVRDQLSICIIKPKPLKLTQKLCGPASRLQFKSFGNNVFIPLGSVRSVLGEAHPGK